MVDKRKFDGFMNCERPGKPSFEEHVRLGPLPGVGSPYRMIVSIAMLTLRQRKWAKSMTATDRLFMFLYKTCAQKKGEPARDCSILDDVIDNGLDADAEFEAELTTSELENYKIHQSLLRSISIIGGSKKPDPNSKDDLDGILTEVEKWLTAKNESLSDTENYAFKDTVHLKNKPLAPSYIYLHSSFTLLETLKALSLFLYYTTTSKAKLSPIKDKSENLHSLVEQVEERVRSNTRLLKSYISEPGVLGELVDLVLADQQTEGSVGSEIAEIIDTAALEVFCGEMMESWEDNLNGVLNVVVVG